MEMHVIGWVVYGIVVFLILLTIILTTCVSCIRRACMPYRLGDVVKCHDTFAPIYHGVLYKNTIAGKYVRDYATPYDLQILNNLVQKHPKEAEVNSVYVHLRLSDTLSLGLNTIDTKNYIAIASRLKKTKKYQNIVICTGTHKTTALDDNSKKQLQAVVGVFEKQSFNVTVHVNRDPDIDFVEMAKSKVFVRSYGGYSTIVSAMVELNGGYVFYDNK